MSKLELITQLTKVILGLYALYLIWSIAIGVQALRHICFAK